MKFSRIQTISRNWIRRQPKDLLALELVGLLRSQPRLFFLNKGHELSHRDRTFVLWLGRYGWRSLWVHRPGAYQFSKRDSKLVWKAITNALPHINTSESWSKRMDLAVVKFKRSNTDEDLQALIEIRASPYPDYEEIVPDWHEP